MNPKKLILLSLISSTLVILFEFFQWKIIDLITPFLMLPVLLLVFGFFIVLTVLAAIALFKSKNWQPIAIQAMTIILLFNIPFTQIVLDLDFKMNKSVREKIVQMVENGTLKPDESSLIQLPDKYRYLSSGGGEIVVEKSGGSLSILFFTFRGVLDGFSGFIYSAGGQKPSKKAFDGDFKEIDKLDKNWYFVSSS